MDSLKLSEPNQNISKNSLNNIKSKYILKKIFENLMKKKSLEFFKYNKKIQKKLEITKKDYKECMESFTSIIIEINLVQEIIERHTLFINISKSEEKQYFHIYFNDNKEEVGREFLIEGDDVQKITIKIDYQIESFYRLFYNCQCIESINFKIFFRTNITDMSYMFYGCTSLNQINFTYFNTDNVDNMRSMFNLCSSLREINLDKFNTVNVKDMSFMFKDCLSLKNIDISNFDLNKVDDISYMFCRCLALKKLVLPILNGNIYYRSSNINMHAMFGQCQSSLKNKVKSSYNYLKDEAFDKYFE